MLQIITDPGLNPPFGSSWLTFGPSDVSFWSLGTTYNQQSTKANYEKKIKKIQKIQNPPFGSSWSTFGPLDASFWSQIRGPWLNTTFLSKFDCCSTPHYILQNYSWFY